MSPQAWPPRLEALAILDMTGDFPLPVPLSLSNGFVPLVEYDNLLQNAPLGPPFAYLSSDGWVSCIGLVTRGTTLDPGTVIGVLPEGMRPSTAMLFPAMVDGGFGAVRVASNGEISFVRSSGVAAGTWISLSNICFNVNAYTNMTLTAPFVANSTALYGQPRYYVSPEGIVCLAGAISGGTLNTGAWTAPVGLGFKTSIGSEGHPQAIATTGDFAYANVSSAIRFLRPRILLPMSLAGIRYVSEGATAPHYRATYMSSWQSYGAGFPPAGATRTRDGMILLHGLIKGGSLGNSAFYLPTGYRPSRDLIFMTPANEAIGSLRIYQDGRVAPIAGSTTWFSLDGIMFAAQR